MPVLHQNGAVIEKYIQRIKFTLFSPEMIRRMSTVKLVVPDTYNEDGYPIDGGLADARMGVIDPGLRCKTCGGSIRTCPGHFGSIELVRPVLHPEFSPLIYMLLRSTCKSCRRVMLPKEVTDEMLHGLMTREEIAATVIDEAKRIKKCPYCDAPRVDIKYEKPTTIYEGEKMLLPTEIRDELAKIPDEDLRLLGFDPEHSRPEWSVMTVLLVPPVSVRPSITLETGERSEDDLTHKLVDIMRINQRLEANINAGAPQLIIEDLWELLQYHITTYFNNESANIPPARHRSGRPLKTLTQRLKGKEGRFRYNLSGKRVNFSARTVVSPDGTISINEVGVPQRVANALTVPIRVTDWNIAECKEFISSSEHPRAVYAVTVDGKRRKITDINKEEILTELASGWVIERQLKEGDIVLFNRHPSLHRMSIMAHSVKILPGKTFRVAPSVTPPYNADFDGDEMNIHIPQREEAKAEAKLLMYVEDQIISPRHGHSVIHPTEDHVSGAAILTRKETSFTIDEASDILAMCGIYELPSKKESISGKVLFSLLLPSNLNLTMKTRLCKCEHCPKDKCPTEGHVDIKDGKLHAGIVEKKTLGRIVEFIAMQHSNAEAAKFIDRVTKMTAYAITRKGFSVSMDNYALSKETSAKMDEIANKAEREVNALVMQYENGTLELAPGRSARQTLEERIMAALSKVREMASNLIDSELPSTNSAILMAKINARGSMLNVEQMAGILSQQAVRSKRLTRGYRKRTLSHFKRGDVGARARGYIVNNFMKGLTPIEYFFHCMGSRESLVNTAIRTARSGYMQRRFINALQDLYIEKDMTVRDSAGKIVQTKYGGDGIDPMKMKKVGEVAAVERD
jgi:DNA-directed RNA polymerase subunit A'